MDGQILTQPGSGKNIALGKEALANKKIISSDSLDSLAIKNKTSTTDEEINPLSPGNISTAQKISSSLLHVAASGNVKSASSASAKVLNTNWNDQDTSPHKTKAPVSPKPSAYSYTEANAANGTRRTRLTSQTYLNGMQAFA